MPSELIAPLLLSIVFVVAAAAAVATRRATLTSANILRIGCVTLVLQALHASEEFFFGFHERFPMLFGLAPWSAGFFVSFNLVWLVLWSLSLTAVGSGRISMAPRTLLWFLALAAFVNGFVHPLLSVLTGSYFPGTLSAIPLGVAGMLLIGRLNGQMPSPR